MRGKLAVSEFYQLKIIKEKLKSHMEELFQFMHFIPHGLK